MARPKDKIYVWASQDVNLPGTGRPNKSKPIDDLLAKGYDKGQKPAAEEFNYILNMSSGWIDWIVNEKFPELEAEITRLLNELEERINTQLNSIRQDIAGLKQDITDLKRYIDQRVVDLRREIAAVDTKVTRLRTDVDAAVANLNTRIDDLTPLLVPIGAVIPWPGQNPPDGWLECNGQVFNTGDNPKLFNVLGRNVVPDYRGLFLRGWAHGSGAFDPDANRGLGSFQNDAFQEHSHFAGAETILFDNVPVSNTRNTPGGAEGRQYSNRTGGVNPIWNNPRYANETRPKNVAVMYVIKTDRAQSSGSNSPTAIVVSPDSITNRVGYSVRATASVLPSSLAGQYPVSWASQNTSVATVDGSGNITLVGPGDTNIIASISTGMNTVIRVTSYSVLTSISIADPGSLEVDQTRQLQVTKNPDSANEPLQFLTNNAGIATVNEAGYVTGVSPGNVTITVRGSLSGVSNTRQVTIVPAVVAQTIEDIQLGVITISDFDDGYNQVPAGCTIVGGDWYTEEGTARLGYKPIQKKINGQWVIISG